VANPQKEHGHVDVANEIVEALAKIRISGEEMQCLWVIIRKTYGWHKKQDDIALSQFCEMTNLKKPTICKVIFKLLAKKIIIVTKKDNGITSYGFNKDFDQWKPLPKKVTLPKKVKIVTQKGKESLPKKLHTKETNTKETTKEIYMSSFEIFWKEYPNKKKKGHARTAWLKIKPDSSLLQKIMDALKRAKNSIEWTEDKGKYIPHPTSWLNAEGWEDVYKPLKSGGDYPKFKDDPQIQDMAKSWRNE